MYCSLNVIIIGNLSCSSSARTSASPANVDCTLVYVPSSCFLLTFPPSPAPEAKNCRAISEYCLFTSSQAQNYPWLLQECDLDIPSASSSSTVFA